MGRRKVIALFIADVGHGDDYQGALESGVDRACREQDLDLFVYTGRCNWTTLRAQRRVYELVDRRRVDGIVLAAGCIASFAPLGEVVDSIRRHCDVPMCAVGQASPGVPSILVDNRGGAKRVVDHLLSVHRFRRFAYLAGPSGHQESEERLCGTREQLEAHGFALPADAVLHGEFSMEFGGQAVREFIRRQLGFDVIIAASDDIALGALDALRAHGLRCPEQVAVVGFDDAVTARVSDPPLTTVRQPVSHAGAAAVACVARQWRGLETAAVVTLETEIVVRDSCGCRATDVARFCSGAAGPDRSVDGSDLEDALAACTDQPEHVSRFALELRAAARAESEGRHGSLNRTVARLIESSPEHHLRSYELHRVLTRLRAWCWEQGLSTAVDEAFHAARVLVGALVYQRVAERHVRYEHLTLALRSTWERLATCLTLPALQEALLDELPRIGLHDAVVSLYPRDSVATLVPLICLDHGAVCHLDGRPYPAKWLMPDGVLSRAERRCLTVVPLTFETEQLGLAVLGFPPGMGAYTLLREQIGSAVKAVYLHQEILNQERLQAQAQEEKRAATERLDSLSLIAGGVAHDLNNVLGPLLALPETIQHDLEEGGTNTVPAEVTKDLETIRLAAQRASHTILDLVALGKNEEIPKAIVNLGRLLESERSGFAEICGRNPGISWRVDLPGGRLLATASKPHVVRAVSNLLINAVDAIQNTGTIVIRAAEQNLSHRVPGVEPVEPGRYAVIEVEDTGSGISSADLCRVFEPFFSAKQQSGRVSSGLGLAIVQRIMRDSGGYVHVDSVVGRGSTFTLYFPMLVQPADPSSKPPPRAVGGRERILVVDDEAVQLRTARRILERLGYRVETAQTPELALRLFAECLPTAPFDLVVVDMVMPGTLNGISAVEEMRRLRPAQKALIASGYAPQEMNALAAAKRLIWLAKPYTLVALAASVRAAIDREA